jgi:CRP/FNR family cyclic AMP-dependent transcriptional regulator
VIGGSVRVLGFAEAGKAVSFADIAAGQVFGEFSAVDGLPRSASVVALTDCHVGRLTSRDLRSVMLAEPTIAIGLLELIVGKACILTDRVFEFSRLPTDSRLHIELLRMSGLLENDFPGAIIDPAPTHQAIAERISSHRDGVTRELNRLRDEGVLLHSRGLIEIRDGNALRGMVNRTSFA